MNNSKKPILTFQVMSDTEVIASVPDDDCNLHFDEALSVIEREAPESSAIYICGDILNRGTADNWIHLNKLIAKHPNIPTVYTTLGNHDLTDNGSYGELFGNYMRYSGMPGTYYDQWIKGYHFITIAQEDTGHNKPIYTDTQFKWLEEKLAENASYDKPIFMFSHYSIRNTSAGTNLGSQVGHAVGSEDKLRFMELLKKYPQIIYITGHTHYPLNTHNTHYNIDFKEEKGADIICDGSGSYLSKGTYFGYPGAQFCFVEVYEDSVVIKGWDITEKRWMDDAVYTIDTTSKRPTDIAVPKIELVPEKIDINDSKDVTAYITFEDRERVLADDGAFVSIVTSNREEVVGDAIRWAMLKDLKQDKKGRYIWHISDDSVCSALSQPWSNIVKRKGNHYIGLFEDTLYLGFKPEFPDYKAYCYDPYARLAKATLTVGEPVKNAIDGGGSKENPYKISTAEQFIYFMDSIIEGETYEGKYFIQTTDLDFSDTFYYIIDSEAVRFAGTYNGCGNVIRNISCAGSKLQEFAAVFPTVTGTVMNLGVEDSLIQGRYAGGIVRRLHNGGKLINCYCLAEILFSERGAGLVNYISGKNSVIDNCYFAGKTQGNAAVGSDWNAQEPIMDRVYCKENSAVGTSPFGEVSVMSLEEMGKDNFVAELNDNLIKTSKLTGMATQQLCRWIKDDGGFPKLNRL